MLVAEIGYLHKPNSTNVVVDSTAKVQLQKTNLSEGFGNYDKKNSLTLEKVNFFNYLKSSFSSFFFKEYAADKSNKLSIIA